MNINIVDWSNAPSDATSAMVYDLGGQLKTLFLKTSSDIDSDSALQFDGIRWVSSSTSNAETRSNPMFTQRPITDNVNHPAHYTGKIECIDAIECATEGLTGFTGLLTGNVIKYIWRWNKKNGIEDLKKARWYLDKLITKVETP